MGGWTTERKRGTETRSRYGYSNSERIIDINPISLTVLVFGELRAREVRDAPFAEDACGACPMVVRGYEVLLESEKHTRPQASR